MQLFQWRFAAFGLSVATLLMGSGAAFADDAGNAGADNAAGTPLGQPEPWGMGMQAAAGPIKADIISLHTLVLVIITLITLFVAGLLVYVMVRFRADKNPTPSQTSHNTILEIAWTVVPILVLVIIAIPSFKLVYAQDRTPNADLTIKVTAHQWYWEYSYPDNGKIDIESRVIADDDQPGHLRLLDVDNQLVLPVGKNIRILITSSDVIHSFFVPSLGLQRYAIPGRTIETWTRIDNPGVFYGECNQICGENHSRMPIAIKGLSEPDFEKWLDAAKTKTSDAAPAVPTRLALAQGGLLRAASAKE